MLYLSLHLYISISIPDIILEKINPLTLRLTGILLIMDGLGGSRTRVQRAIPCPSTIVAYHFGLLLIPSGTGRLAPLCVQ